MLQEFMADQKDIATLLFLIELVSFAYVVYLLLLIIFDEVRKLFSSIR